MEDREFLEPKLETTLALDPWRADAELARRARAGDASAFDRLYEANVGRVYALCLRMCGDAAEAETLTQDVFVRAWERLDRFRGECALSSWLHRVAVNVVLQDRRSSGRRAARIGFVAEPEAAAPARAAAPGLSVEERMELERAVATLPPGARTVLILHDIEGYTHEEIGALCGTAAGTAKAQLHRARKLLRERLDR